MTNLRELLEEYVHCGKLMQLATLTADGWPSVSNVWYDAHFDPDILRFISRDDRLHSASIRNDGRVAGSVIAMPLEGLGQKVRGVTFTGVARELGTHGIGPEAETFVKRWPASRPALDPYLLARGDTHTRMYEVAVIEWVLFDEVNFPEQPRQVVAARPSGSPVRERHDVAMTSFRFHHVAVSVDDISESILFYGQFGFRPVLEYVDPDGRFEVAHLKLGNAFLEIWKYRQYVAAPQSASKLSTDLPRIGWKHLALQVASLEEVMTMLSARGIPVVVAPRIGNTGVSYLFVKDPSGNLVEFLEDHREL